MRQRWRKNYLEIGLGLSTGIFLRVVKGRLQYVKRVDYFTKIIGLSEYLNP